MEKVKTQTHPTKNVEAVQNKEEVRIYRLSLLEENQIKILKKIEELETNLDEKYDKEINKHDKRISKLEDRKKLVDKLIWIVAIETVAFLFLILQRLIGV